MNSQKVAYQVRASEAPGKSIVRGWPIKFVHQGPPVNEQSAMQNCDRCVLYLQQMVEKQL